MCARVHSQNVDVLVGVSRASSLLVIDNLPTEAVGEGGSCCRTCLRIFHTSIGIRFGCVRTGLLSLGLRFSFGLFRLFVRLFPAARRFGPEYRTRYEGQDLINYRSRLTCVYLTCAWKTCWISGLWTCSSTWNSSTCSCSSSCDLTDRRRWMRTRWTSHQTKKKTRRN